MDDKAHIAFVDAHSEGNRRDDDVNFVAHPSLLDIASGCIRHPSVVEVALDFEFAELRA